jgi:hypothetical protein
MPVPTKKIRERVTKMSTAWKQSAPNVTFKGITQSAFQADIEAAAAIEEEIASLDAEVKVKMQERDAAYQKLNDDSINVRDGVEGDVNFGTNHPLYAAMGFTPEAERKSGLTRKKRTPTGANS